MKWFQNAKKQREGLDKCGWTVKEMVGLNKFEIKMWLMKRGLKPRIEEREGKMYLVKEMK